MGPFYYGIHGHLSMTNDQNNDDGHGNGRDKIHYHVICTKHSVLLKGSWASQQKYLAAPLPLGLPHLLENNPTSQNLVLRKI